MADLEKATRILRYLQSIPGTRWSMRGETEFVLDEITDQEAFDAYKASLPERRHIDLSSFPVLSVTPSVRH